jgi:hypothetical protein
MFFCALCGLYHTSSTFKSKPDKNNSNASKTRLIMSCIFHLACSFPLHAPESNPKNDNDTLDPFDYQVITSVWYVPKDWVPEVAERDI